MRERARVHIRGFDTLPQGDRDHHRANHSLLALMATLLDLRNRTTELATREFARFTRT